MLIQPGRYLDFKLIQSNCGFGKIQAAQKMIHIKTMNVS